MRQWPVESRETSARSVERLDWEVDAPDPEDTHETDAVARTKANRRVPSISATSRVNAVMRVRDPV